jgi:excisionase family DNA binding protein
MTDGTTDAVESTVPEKVASELTTREVARQLGISRQAVVGLIRRGRLMARSIGGNGGSGRGRFYLVDPESIEAYRILRVLWSTKPEPGPGRGGEPR